MLDFLVKMVGALPAERKPVLLLLGKGFFMGIFLASYQIGVEVIFLKTPGLGAEHLATAIFAAGVCALISAFIFVYLQKRIAFSKLVAGNLIFFTIFLIAISFLYEITSKQGIQSAYYKEVVFVSFMMMGPIMAIILLGFWGTFNRIFDLKASKRIIGGIDTGQLTATIIAFFSIGLIPEQYYDSSDLILLSAISVTGALFFLLWIVREFDLTKYTKDQQTDVAASPYSALFKDKYLKLLSLFLILSMIATVFMDFTFLTTIDLFYPEEYEMKTYLAFFSGVVMMGSFFIQTFVNDIIIGKYGLKVSLLVMPGVLGLFTTGAMVSGYIFGYEIKNEELIYFFMFVSMGKFVSAAFKDALENPAFKLYFLPLDIRIRFDIQSKIEGVVNEFSGLLAGILLVLLGLDFMGIKLIHYSFFIMGLVTLMYFVTNKLYEQYRGTLKETLERYKKKMVKDERGERNAINLLQKQLDSNQSEKVIYALKLMEKIEPIILEHSLTKLIQDKSTAIREYALRRIDDLKSFGAMDAVKQQLNVEDSPEIKKIAAEAVEHLTEADGISLSEEILLKMVRSTNSEDRVYAARLMSKVTDERLFPYLSELIRDINHQVRIAALVSAGKVKSPEFWPALIANLSSPTYSNASAASIVTIGEPILPTLEAAFNKTGQIPQTMVRIVQIYGRIQGKDAEELLWKKIDTTDKNVFSQVLVSLSDMGYRAQEFQAARIKLTIETDIEDVAWNLEALDAIEEADKEEQEKSEENKESIVRNNYIRQALLEENHYNFDHIYMLLSMNYDPESIRLVKENVESGLTDNITFAIELLDVFMTEDLKPKLFPIIDDITQSERTKRLDEYFPPQNFENLEDLYLRIINRDYNRIDRWTKAVAIYNLGHLDGAVPGPALVANLFNPDPLIRQTAAWAIHELDKMTYQTNTRRLAPSVKKELDRVILPPTLITQDQHRPMLQVERIMLLSEIEIFSHIPRIVLAELSDYVEEVRYKEGTTIISQGDSGDTPMYIVVSGKINVFDQDKLVGELGKKEMIGETHVLDSDTNTASFITAEETAVFRLDKDKFYELICKNQEMVDGLITIMHKKFEEEPGPVVG